MSAPSSGKWSHCPPGGRWAARCRLPMSAPVRWSRNLSAVTPFPQCSAEEPGHTSANLCRSSLGDRKQFGPGVPSRLLIPSTGYRNNLPARNAHHTDRPSVPRRPIRPMSKKAFGNPYRCPRTPFRLPVLLVIFQQWPHNAEVALPNFSETARRTGTDCRSRWRPRNRFR